MKKTQRSWNSTLRRTSAKRRKENRLRTKVLAELRAEDPMCRRCRVRVAVDGHELLPRSAGGSITDKAGIVLLCRKCHAWIDEKPQQAMAEGWKISRYAKQATD